MPPGLSQCNGSFGCDGSRSASRGVLPRRSFESRSKISYDLAGAPLWNRTVDLLLTMGFRSGRPDQALRRKARVRGSASARLGQVQGGSRRMRPPKFLPAGHGGGAHVRPRFHQVRYLFDKLDRFAGENRCQRPAACSAPTATNWPTMTGANSRRAASIAPSASPRQQLCWQWRPSRLMSLTGTPTRSSAHTARQG